MPKPEPRLGGQLLLDGGTLRGSYFSRTVVFVCSHDEDGAFGLVLNRPTETQLQAAFDRTLPSSLRQRPLFGGGPVQPAALSFLYPGKAKEPAKTPLPGVVLHHDLDALIQLGKHPEARVALRVFAGYAGWSPGQLDDEMKRKAWLTHPASLELLFDVPPETLWQHILRNRGSWRDRLLAMSPEDFAVN
jgi:putative transcriptional regulator